METIHLEVEGRVQGVGFRWFVVEKAEELGVGGWVRNRPDGRVEIAAAGARDALQKLEVAIREGPSGARVEAVRTLAQVEAGSLSRSFEIVR
ncbi:MAG TPA: acylphosphatase [Gemmatimonadaceae bacterium]|jgi:acylphosphatase|nr:acylphosphatase [Gemmatimonadaceae bacterium]